MMPSESRWQVGMGDPNVVGWFTVAAYGLACLLCWQCARRSGSAPERRVWWLMAAVMLLLGINKQLDLQSWLTQLARDMALAGGWYEHRRVFQALSIFWLGVGVLGLKAWLGVRSGSLHRYTRLAGMGMLVLGAFVVLRAASFHHVDALLGLNFVNMRLNVVFELGGISLIIYGAFRYKPVVSRVS